MTTSLRVPRFSAGRSNLPQHKRKNIALCQEAKDELHEAIGHEEWGRVLAYQGRWQQANRCATDEVSTAESELTYAFEKFERQIHFQYYNRVFAYRSLSIFLQNRINSLSHHPAKEVAQLAIQALEQAGLALEYVVAAVEIEYPAHRNFIRAYWLLGEALLQCLAANASLREQKFDIHFYDEPFQHITETLRLQKDNALHAAERCLSEALCRCRSVNMVEMEPNFLLAWARLERQKAKGKQQGEKSKQQKEKSNKAGADFRQMEEYAKEAREIAERAGYRLALTDIHLFCAEVGLELRENVGAHGVETGRRPVSTGTTNSTNPQQLLGLSIEQHLHKAKEYALDVSEYAHLYQSLDPHFYDGIPEAAMLKRGMTQQERIDNGYWVAYQIALALEQRLAAQW